MSYGAKGPPKGYSNPRDPTVTNDDARPACQRCSKAGHWSYECPTAAASSTGASAAAAPARIAAGKTATGGAPPRKLSRTEMIKRGLKRVAVAAAPPQTEQEDFKADLKERAALLEDELREVAREEREEKNAEAEATAAAAAAAAAAAGVKRGRGGRDGDEEDRRDGAGDDESPRRNDDLPPESKL